MPNIAKDCHENKSNTSDKNWLKASKYAEIEVQKLNDKNFIRLPRQDLIPKRGMAEISHLLTE